MEKPLREKFARIGIEAGKPFPLAALTAEQKEALEAGIKSGLEKIKKKVATLGKDENGWRVGGAQGDRAFYKGDWTLRAAAAMAGIYGNDAVEALYPLLAASPDLVQKVGLLEKIASQEETQNVSLYGLPTMDARVATFAFNVDGVPPREAATRLGEAGYAVWQGNYYAVEVMKRLGLEDGGAVRAGFVHYNTPEEVDGLLEALGEI